MKLAPKVIFLIRDSEGFASAISRALRPNPPFTVTTRDECFEFSLEEYGMKDHKASGSIVHYLDDKGIYQPCGLLGSSIQFHKAMRKDSYTSRVVLLLKS